MQKQSAVATFWRQLSHKMSYQEKSQTHCQVLYCGTFKINLVWDYSSLIMKCFRLLFWMILEFNSLLGPELWNGYYKIHDLYWWQTWNITQADSVSSCTAHLFNFANWLFKLLKMKHCWINVNKCLNACKEHVLTNFNWNVLFEMM